MIENILIPIVIDKYIPDVTNRLFRKIIDIKTKKIALIGFSENMRWLNRLLIEHNISPILNDWRPKYFGYDCGKNKVDIIYLQTSLLKCVLDKTGNDFTNQFIIVPLLKQSKY